MEFFATHHTCIECMYCMCIHMSVACTSCIYCYLDIIFWSCYTNTMSVLWNLSDHISCHIQLSYFILLGTIVFIEPKQVCNFILPYTIIIHFCYYSYLLNSYLPLFLNPFHVPYNITDCIICLWAITDVPTIVLLFHSSPYQRDASLFIKPLFYIAVNRIYMLNEHAMYNWSMTMRHDSALTELL